MLVDRGNDFGTQNQETLDSYGRDMWIFRDQADRGTTKALNLYRGEIRGLVSYVTFPFMECPKYLKVRVSHAPYPHNAERLSPFKSCSILALHMLPEASTRDYGRG